MHEAFGRNSRAGRPWSFEIVETDFFPTALGQIHPRGWRGLDRSRFSRWYSKRVEKRFIRHPFGRTKPCSFLAEHRRFISTVYIYIGVEGYACPLLPLTSLRTTVTRTRCRQYYFLLSLLWILPRLCRINTSERACTTSSLFFLSLGFLVIPFSNETGFPLISCT